MRRISVAASTLVALLASPASGAGAAKVVKGPYLTGLSESGVEVRFELDGLSAAAVEVKPDKPDAGAPHRFEDGAATDMHIVRVGGLAPSSRYGYVVRVAGKSVGTGTFVTAPRPGSGASLMFLVDGDNRSDPTAHAAVVRAMAAAPGDFLINTGDMVEDGGRPEDWQTFFDTEAALLRNRALFVAIGNHELYDDRAGANFARYFGFSERGSPPRPYGTVRLGNVRFFFLNAMHDWSSGEERQWLERELTSADSEEGLVWRMAVMHQAPASSGPHGGNPMMKDAHVTELLGRHGVDLILAGHDHLYERGETDSVKYVISGGGGAPLYRIAHKVAESRKDESAYHFLEVTVDDHAVKVVALRLDGSVIEQCGFARAGDWDCDPPGPSIGPAPSGSGAVSPRPRSGQTGSGPVPPGSGPVPTDLAAASAADQANAGWLPRGAVAPVVGGILAAVAIASVRVRSKRRKD